MQTEKQKQWYEANKERIKAKSKAYYVNNLSQVKEYRENNKDKIRENNYEYYINNNLTINEKRKAKHKEKIKEDSLYRIKHNVRGMFSRCFRKNSYNKLTKSELILGCSFEDFKTYIESKFETWMHWDNYGLYNGELNHGWDIDHIEPMANAITVEDVIRLNHYTNLQPLCSKINRYIKIDN